MRVRRGGSLRTLASTGRARGAFLAKCGRAAGLAVVLDARAPVLACAQDERADRPTEEAREADGVPAERAPLDRLAQERQAVSGAGTAGTTRCTRPARASARPASRKARSWRRRALTGSSPVPTCLHHEGNLGSSPEPRAGIHFDTGPGGAPRRATAFFVGSGRSTHDGGSSARLRVRACVEEGVPFANGAQCLRRPSGPRSRSSGGRVL